MSRFDMIYADENLSHRARTVYIYLYDRAGTKRKCWPSIRTIARELALSKSTVKRAITDLKDAGYIETEQQLRTNGGKSSLLYHIIK